MERRNVLRMDDNKLLRRSLGYVVGGSEERE